ncbi:MAG: hypothetical protein AAFN51_09510, partial [Pseudomonadota bacterium]
PMSGKDAFAERLARLEAEAKGQHVAVAAPMGNAAPASSARSAAPRGSGSSLGLWLSIIFCVLAGLAFAVMFFLTQYGGTLS